MAPCTRKLERAAINALELVAKRTSGLLRSRSIGHGNGVRVAISGGRWRRLRWNASIDRVGLRCAVAGGVDRIGGNRVAPHSGPAGVGIEPVVDRGAATGQLACCH